ncbi:PREDICTED: uncharacterized protein LOC105975257 [Erythranthe guttata]|uniref:uncharacterized protein LOC105975257 n=1 Tax=Erythranthe guttata TaxID=4155 RepID=UPI00064D9577|nr:PREDICTED: uncharacterized protein LOC105975257 [Erythranthe guttata]|eukprot:XP_012855889.1 PREDICTED: uncharacterized protein LOC105975257 [Erythranthe guttata]
MVKFGKKNDDAMQQIEQLQHQYGVAARVCEEAIANKESIEKSYRDKMLLLGDCSSDAVLAHLYVASADRVGLSRYCKNNVEKFMKCWNRDEEFRREYAKFNESSTITRFGSFDGARLFGLMKELKATSLPLSTAVKNVKETIGIRIKMVDLIVAS